MAITDTSETVTKSYAYAAYGQMTGESGLMSQPFTYVGEYGVMAELGGLYYMRARYYDPEVGRFISEDPIEFEGGQTNLYAYVGGNPINRMDPSGLVEWVNLGFGLVDFGLSAGEAVAGLGIMISSTATGPAAPAVFVGGTALVSHGALGMINSGLAIQNALFETNGPGLFEGAGGALFGDAGANPGQAIDLFTGLRPGTIASGSINNARDIYDITSSGNTVRNTFLITHEAQLLSL